jgi:hypothetical protein
MPQKGIYAMLEDLDRDLQIKLLDAALVGIDYFQFSIEYKDCYPDLIESRYCAIIWRNKDKIKKIVKVNRIEYCALGVVSWMEKNIDSIIDAFKKCDDYKVNCATFDDVKPINNVSITYAYQKQ